MLSTAIGRNKRLKFGSFVIYAVLTVGSVITLYPLWYVIMVAFSDYEKILGKAIILWPHGFTFESLKYMYNSASFIRVYGNTIFVVVVGTALSMLVMIPFSYGISRKVRGYRFLNYFTFFTLIFSGGMIPTFLVVKATKLLNSLWALIIPIMVSPFNTFILKNFFDTIPTSLDESAEIDGASPFRIMLEIIIPVSLAGMATVIMFISVRYWNEYFNCLIYNTKREMWNIQMLLNEVLNQSQADLLGGGESSSQNLSYTVKMACVMMSILPIMALYPFVQRYFIKGVIIGAVKG